MIKIILKNYSLIINLFFNIFLKLLNSLIFLNMLGFVYLKIKLEIYFLF